MKTEAALREKLVYWVLFLYTVCVYGSMAVMSVGAALVFAAWLWGRYALKSEGERSPLFFASMGLAVACIWSLVWAKMTRLTFYGQAPDIHFLSDSAKLWHVFFVFILSALLSRQSEKNLQKLMLAWFVCGLLSAVLGIVQHYVPLVRPQELPNPGLKPGMFGLYHATGLSGFHLSYVSILGFPTFVALAFMHDGLKSRGKRWLWAGAFALFILANYFAFSKGNWIAVPVVFFIYTFLETRGKLFWCSNAVAVLALAVMAAMPQFRARFELGVLIFGPLRDRLQLWQANWQMIKQNVLFGVGWHHNSDLSGAFYRYMNMPEAFRSHAHNNFLDQLATTGVVGLIFFTLWNWVVLRRSFRLSRMKGRSTRWNLFFRGIFYGWLCLHINGLTQTNFWDAKVLHQLGWVAAFTLSWPLERRRDA